MLPYYERLHGYTLPIVISALKEIGHPLAIDKVCEKQRGPLLVTLAAELAAIVVGLIYESKLCEMGLDEFERLVMILGGEDYQSAVRNYENAFQRENELISTITKLENLIKRFCSQKNIRKIYDSKTTISWETTHRKLSAELCLISKDVCSARRRMKSQRLKALISPDFANAMQRHLATLDRQQRVGNEITIDFDGLHPLLKDSSADVLRLTEPEWWQKFKDYVSKCVKTTTNHVQVRLMLRDSLLCQTVRLLAAERGGRIDDSWIEGN